MHRYHSSAIAAFLVLVAGCGSTQQGASTSPSLVAASPAASSPAVAATSFDAVDPGGRLAAGTYVLRYATIAGDRAFPTLSFEFTVPAGWQKVGLEGLLWSDDGTKLGFAVPDGVYADPCDVEQGLLDAPLGPTIDELTLALHDVRGWEAAFEWDRYLGFMGSHLTLTPLAERSACEEPMRLMRVPGWPGFVEVFGVDSVLDLWILNVRGERVVIYTSTPEDISADARAELQAVFESIRITP